MLCSLYGTNYSLHSEAYTEKITLHNKIQTWYETHYRSLVEGRDNSFVKKFDIDLLQEHRRLTFIRYETQHKVHLILQLVKAKKTNSVRNSAQSSFNSLAGRGVINKFSKKHCTKFI